jgi:hypothetical protein
VRTKSRRGMPNRTSWVLLTAFLCVSASLMTAQPAAAEIPPFIPCTPYNSAPPLPVGQREPQIADDGTGDYAIWECKRSKNTPYIYYWQMTEINNFEEQAEAIGRSASRYIRDGVWEGLVQGGFGIFQSSESHRAHLRYEGSFELWDWNRDSTLRRDMGVHMVLKHSVSGGPWTNCGDTGWKNAPEPRARTSYTFYKLTSSCPGRLQLFTQAHFFQISTHSWWTSPWLAGKVHEPNPV